MDWWDKLVENWHPDDQLSFPDSKREMYYRVKYQIVKSINPRSICEIGVRAGYSAFAFLSAAPSAKYLGIDMDKGTDGGVIGYYKHAEKLLSEFDSKILIEDSQNLDSLPGKFDFIHVDGDHSIEGCLHDIIISVSAGKFILVDDYDYIENVRIACEHFKKENPEHTYTYIPDNYHGNLLIGVKQYGYDRRRRETIN